MKPTKKGEKYKSIREGIQHNEDLFNYYDHDYDNDYYEDYDDYWYSSNGWEYIENTEIYLPCTKNYRSRSPICLGRMIKMDSIYSKEMLRQKRIDEILGLDTISVIRPKIEDFL